MYLSNYTAIKEINEVINISGNWINHQTPKWIGSANAESSMVSITFFEIDNKIAWLKSERARNNNFDIHINIFNYDKTGLDVQFNCFFNNSINSIRAQIDSVNILPKIYDGNVNSGRIYLFSTFDSKPKINLYVLFIPMNIIKVGRNGIWKIKNNYLNLIDEKFIKILQTGRKGKM
jgi:uncharacterized protein YcfL